MARNIEDYERALIGSVLLTPGRMADAVTAGTSPEWFTSDAWGLMWSALANFWRRGEIDGITPLNVKAEAERIASNPKDRRDATGLTAAAIEQAIEDAGLGPIDITIDLLRSAAVERAAKKAVAETFQLFPQYHDASDVVAKLRARLDKILGGIFEQKKIPPRAVFAEIMAEYEEAHKMRVAADGPRDLKWTPGIKMPWPKMTEFMNGLRPGLHIIAARPSVGKTAFAVNLMHFWCEQGVPVLFCSLDMPMREVMRRYIAERARVSARKAAFSPTAADLDAMRKAVGAMESWPLSVIETRDVDELRTIALVEKAAGRLGVIVVDYLQLMHARALGREDAVEYSRVSYVSDTLKRLANELQVPVVALAQLNRESTKNDAAGRMPGLSDLRGSGAIEQDAFTVAILHRDAATVEKWRKGEGTERALRLIPGTLDNPNYRYNMDDIDPIWWVLCKAQNGPTGALPFVVRKKYFCWMLGDYEAEAKSVTSGYGATMKSIVDNSAKFERVHSDWRHDPIEEVLRLQLALIESADDVKNVEEEDA
jgi:replicative DNA helicase